MITEDYVNFEMAKLLKEKGFDEPISNCYLELDEGGYIDIEMSDECHQNERYDSEDSSWKFGTLLLRPTHQMTMKWLREVHKIFIYIEPFITTSGLQGYKPYCTKIGGEFMWINPLRKYSNTSSDTYEEACESAIEYCLKNLI